MTLKRKYELHYKNIYKDAINVQALLYYSTDALSSLKC